MTKARMLGALLCACLPVACGSGATGLGVTGDGLYTVRLEAPEGFVQAGDKLSLLVTLRRNDGSPLLPLPGEEILVTSSMHGRVEGGGLMVNPADAAASEFQRHLVYTAAMSGLATVRASFRDATAALKIPIAKSSF